jgi:putative ABC transport system permease protein
VLRSFDSLAFRQLRTRPLRAVLTAFGVVLGVGMVFGVLLLVGTIRGTFDTMLESAFGKQELVVNAKAGTLPQAALKKVENTEGVTGAGSMIGAVFNRIDQRGKTIKGLKGQLMVAGIDPYGRPPYRMHLIAGRGAVFGPETVLERKWAKDAGLGIGDSIRVASPSGPVRLRVIGLFGFENGASMGGIGYATMPLREARRMMETPSGWMQIVASVDKTSDLKPVQKRLQNALGPGVDVKTPAGWGKEISKQLDALNVVLYFFSGIALFVGGFLILNSFNMTVLQRMREIGMLRTLGASRGMVARTVLEEALVVGIVGTLLGLGLGLGLAKGLIAMMRGIGVPVGSLTITAGSAITASILGIVVTAAGAWWPARRAGRIPPIRAALGDTEPRKRPSVRRGLVGLALFLPGLIFGGELFMGGSGAGDAMLGMLVTMVMFVGMAMAAPFVILPIAAAMAPIFKRLFPASGRLAVDSLRSNATRTAATAAALTIGLSVVIVNSSMSASFIGTIREQLTQGFARDFNVQPQGYTIEQGGGPGIPQGLVDRVHQMPEVAVATPVRAQVTTMPKTDEQGVMVGVDPIEYPRVDKSPIKGATREEAYRRLGIGGVILGANYAYKTHLKVGDTIVLRGPRSSRQAPIVGITQTLEPRDLQMSLATMRDVYGVTANSQLAVKAWNASQAPPLERRVQKLVTDRYSNLELVSLAGRKAEIEREVNQQFNFFNAIVAIAVIVSLLGVVNTLAMSVIERTREIGVLRALGSSRWLVRQTMLDESLMITLAGAIAGILVGLLIGFVWVGTIGGVMPGITFHVPLGTIIGVAIASIIAGVVAAALPARRAARLQVIRALTYE